ncbi:MAG: FeoA family protein [Candidatus Gastranaerophilales bacterium]|nr:FeoA family protein [Candidatus Gastranaerophilales bacterium]
METTLKNIEVGQKACIKDFADSQTQCYSCRFGLAKGQIVTCIAKPGAIVLKKNHQEIAIGKKLSEKIFIEIK